MFKFSIFILICIFFNLSNADDNIKEPKSNVLILSVDQISKDNVCYKKSDLIDYSKKFSNSNFGQNFYSSLAIGNLKISDGEFYPASSTREPTLIKSIYCYRCGAGQNIALANKDWCTANNLPWDISKADIKSKCK